MEENLRQLEATYGAPASLFERSAAARAKASGSTTEAVVAQWVGEDGPSADSSSVPSLSGGSAAESGGGGQAPAEPVPSSDTAAAATGALSGAALLAAVAEARGMPESLIERSAKARASATGGSIDDVLQEWAQEEGLTVSDSSPSSSIPPAQGEVPPSGGGGGQTATAPSGVLSGAALLAAVAEARGMPESLIERSASARAKTAGVAVDDILRDWAQEEGLLEAPAAPDSSPSSSIPPAQGEVPPPGGGGGQAATAPSGVLSGAALLAAVAEARKMPESLVERSAKARAKSADGSVDDVLLEWAKEEGLDVSDSSPSGGGGSGEAADGEGQASTAPEPSTDIDEPEDIEELVDSSDVGPAPKVDIPSPIEPEPIEEPEAEVPASPRSRYPAWLAAVLIIIPLLAVLYVVVVPNQPTCGSAGQLAIDPATGNAVGCDGGEYGVDAVSNFSAGAAIYDAGCAVCHGATGGGGAGPAMAGGAVLATFPEAACASQIEWIALGSADWPDATYGANDTPVAGGMPGFEGQLTELEIAQVALFERVEFGGLDVEAAETACGFGIEEG
jgi:mono/diheme cytochrome c family protein